MAKKIAVIGGGAVGSSTAWYLAQHGHELMLIDPLLNQATNRFGVLNGTAASLGVLMGNVYRRSSGRGWRLRQRSMKLWKEWIIMLNSLENPLYLESPLVQLASSREEAYFMEKLSQDRKHLGLEIIDPNTTINHARSWPNNSYGGLISHHDGRINPLQLQKCLLHALDTYKAHKVCDKVISLERESTTRKKQWKLHLANGKSYSKEIVVICAAQGTETLLKPLGHNIPIAPVLGQVLDLELQTDEQDWARWPAVLISERTNLIPYRNNRLILGATLEPGTEASQTTLEKMQTLNGKAPDWLKNSSVLKSWHGLRARPIDTPAPILKKLEPGLIIATGHYRNGILLAPASAEWVGQEVIKEEENPTT